MFMGSKNNYYRWGMIVFLFFMISLPFFITYAQETESANLVPCGQSVKDASGKVTIPNPCGYQDFLELLKRVFDYLVTYIAVPLAAGTIVVGGAIMMTAGTNDSKRSQAKKIIWAAVRGLVIVLASYLIVKLVFDFLVEPSFVPTNFRN